MSGGRFRISAEDVCWEKILRIKSLVREGFNIDDKVMLEEDHSSGLQDLLYSLSEAIGDRDSITLAEKSRDVSDSIAGNFAHKTVKYCNGCCQEYVIDQGNTPQHNNYLSKLSRGGLLVPSEGLSVFESQEFALL